MNNLSGVRGIGKKTAAELLGEFDTLGEILSRPVHMGASLRAKLKGQEENALLCKRLATLATDLEI